MSTLAQEHDGLLVDLDGVVYVGAGAVPGAVAALVAAHDAGLAWSFVTNNASRPAAQVADHLAELGLPVGEGDVVTSAQIAASLVVDRLGRGARVLAVGGPGVAVALRQAGLEPVTSPQDHPAAVVQGFGRDVGWTHLADATVAVRAGALFVATNTDVVIPTERGPAPGNGTLVAAVRAATGTEPLVAGKPEAVAFREPARRAGMSRPLVVGDRLDTDIAGGVAAGMATLHVLTGVHGPHELLAAAAGCRPRHVGADLGALHLPVPTVEVAEDRTWARSGSELVRVADGVLTRSGRGDGDALAALRAALPVAWAAADAGQPCRADADLERLWQALRP